MRFGRRKRESENAGLASGQGSKAFYKRVGRGGGGEEWRQNCRTEAEPAERAIVRSGGGRDDGLISVSGVEPAERPTVTSADSDVPSIFGWDLHSHRVDAARRSRPFLFPPSAIAIIVRSQKKIAILVESAGFVASFLYFAHPTRVAL